MYPQQHQPSLSGPEDINSRLLILSKFEEHDIQILKQLLVTAEKNKWKQITKEINHQALIRRGVIPPEGQVEEAFGNAKNVLPTFVIKQYQLLLGLPNNALYFGTIGLLLPYIISERGWDDILNEVE